jgi:hypothetical protein
MRDAGECRGCADAEQFSKARKAAGETIEMPQEKVEESHMVE